MAVSYAGEGVSRLRLMVASDCRPRMGPMRLMRLMGTAGLNRKPQTANCKPLTVALESIMERNLVEAIDPDTEIIDEAIF